MDQSPSNLLLDNFASTFMLNMFGAAGKGRSGLGSSPDRHTYGKTLSKREEDFCLEIFPHSQTTMKT